MEEREGKEVVDEQKSSQDLLLAAGRLEAQMGVRPDQNNVHPKDIITCSIDNLLAIVDTPFAIKLIHLAAPQRQHLLAIQEKPYMLSFSPRGDALFAAFHTGKICCLWTRSSQALNEWEIKQTWADWQGDILDLRWMSATRRWSSIGLKRKSARGPQFIGESMTFKVGAVAVCDSGQVYLFHGSIAGDLGMQTQTTSITLHSQERLAQAAIGLVPDESTTLVAYTKRLSSKASVSRSTAEGDALGMFFEGGPEVVALDKQQSSTSHLEDGQDIILLAEFRIDLTSSPTSLIQRPLLPIYLSSYEVRSMPTALSLTNLIWLDELDKPEADMNTTKMHLFASFYQESTTTLRIWQLQREEVEVLSEAFTKLEAAKHKMNEEGREDWIAKATLHQIYPDYIGDHYQFASSGQTLLCSWTHAPAADHLSNVTKPRTEYRLIDCSTLQVIEDKAAPGLQNSSCQPGLSANGCLAAQVINGKVRVTEMSKNAWWTTNNALAYFPALVAARDISDVLRTCSCDLEAIANAVSLDETSYEQISRVLQLAAQTDSQAGHKVMAKNSRLLLEIVQCYNVLKEADKEAYWDQSQIWVIVSVLEWTIWLVESMAKQAYLRHATAAVSTPAQTEESSENALADGGADFLALMSVALPRKILVQCIIRLVKFCKWLHRMNHSKEEVKTMMSNIEFQKALKSHTQSKVWSFADRVRIAQVRVNEVMFNSAIDLSQTGRVLKTFSDDIKEEESAKRKWWIRLDDGNRSKMADALIEGNCIRTALPLFCPAKGDIEGDTAGQRDIMTKAKLSVKDHHYLCLSCSAKTQMPLAFGKKCICGSQSWWKVL